MSTIITAIASFVSTNIDDIFILMIFFSNIKGALNAKYIVAGQYLGIGVLVGISILGGLGVSLFLEKYIGFLGFIPIYLGIKEYLDYRKSLKYNSEDDSNNNLNIGVLNVAAITIANGGDNIGIYVPMFAKAKGIDLIIIIIVFILFTALWCYIGFKLVKYPFIELSIKKYKHIIVPIVFIFIGTMIILESESLDIILKLIK